MGLDKLGSFSTDKQSLCCKGSCHGVFSREAAWAKIQPTPVYLLQTQSLLISLRATGADKSCQKIGSELLPAYSRDLGAGAVWPAGDSKISAKDSPNHR